MISAQSTDGKEKLVQAIKQQLLELMVPYTLFVPSQDGQTLSALRRQTLVLKEHFVEEKNGYEVKGFAKSTSKWLNS